MTSNFTCLDAVSHAYQTCVDQVVTTVTFSTTGYIGPQGVQFINCNFLLSLAAIFLVAALLVSCTKLTFSASFRQELSETLEIIVNLFTAHLSFVALLINSVWLFGQILAAVCDMLTLNPR